MVAANLTFNVPDTATQFQRANTQTKLAVLHFLARKIHQTSKTTKPSAIFSQRVHGVLKQLQQLPKEERYAALEEILNGDQTRMAEAYEALDTNMRMAFWYELANSRRGEALFPIALLQDINVTSNQLLSDLESRDSNELVSFLREAVQETAIA